MAWVVTRQNGRREIRFRDQSNKVKIIRLGEFTKKAADTFAANLSQMINFHVAQRAMDSKLIEWYVALPLKLRDRINAAGLRFGIDGEVKDVVTLEQWCKIYLEKRTDLKASTREQFEISIDNLKACFAPTRSIDSFTEGCAEDFRIWLVTTKQLAENTARRRMGRAKQLFSAAVRRKLIDHNPFQHQKAAVGANPKRQAFVPHEVIEACIRKSPCESWRIIIALARYGGLRRDECLAVRWPTLIWSISTSLCARRKPSIVRTVGFESSRYFRISCHTLDARPR